MTSLTLLSSSNKTLAHVRRPVRLVLNVCYIVCTDDDGTKAIALTPPSNFLFSKPTSIRISVPLVDAFVASSSNLAAIVEIGRRDSWMTLGKGEGREVNVASASLRGLVVPHGIRYDTLSLFSADADINSAASPFGSHCCRQWHQLSYLS